MISATEQQHITTEKGPGSKGPTVESEPAMAPIQADPGAPSLDSGGSPLPLYKKIQKYILELIQSGEWKPGAAIPSEPRLAESLGVSRMTVNRAVRELASQGLLTRLQGVGTFVARKEPEFALLEIRDIAQEISESGGGHKAKVIFLRQEEATSRIARGLGLAPGAPVFHSLILHLDGDRPVQLEDRFVNPQVVPDYLDQDFTLQTPNRYLTKTVPLSVIEAEHVIEAIRPDQETRRLLEIPAEEPCLVLNRRTWTGSATVTLVRLIKPREQIPASRARFKP